MYTAEITAGLGSVISPYAMIRSTWWLSMEQI
jgi:hypothetical protein